MQEINRVCNAPVMRHFPGLLHIAEVGLTSDLAFVRDHGVRDRLVTRDAPLLYGFSIA